MAYPEESLERLLDYHGKVYILSSGHWLKFEVRRVEPSPKVPHGMAYSFTLHAPGGERLVGFDNAHPVPHPGSSYTANPVESDHWHRDRNDPGRPYRFVDADRLVADFFEALERTLDELGVPFDIQSEQTR